MDDSRFNSELVENLVKKRLANFDYIKRVHQGSVHWMNSVLLTQEDIRGFYVSQESKLKKPRAGTVSASSTPKRKRTRYGKTL